MIMGFKQRFPWGEPTYFREKILSGVGFGPLQGPPKIHTMRAAKRWKPGDLIHMAYGVRSENYEQFNKNIEGLQRVISVQDVTVKGNASSWSLVIDGKDCSDKMPFLIVNDGFSNSDEFFKWFKKPFTGQIVHWTDWRY